MGHPERHVLLDSRGERLICIPRRQRRDLEQTDGFAAGHAGHVDSQGHFAGAAAWLRNFAAHRADIQRPAGDSAGGVVSRAVPAGTSRLGHQRMGEIRKQAQGEILPADRRGQAALAGGNGKVEPHDGRDCRNPGDEAGGSMRLLNRVRSWWRGIFQRSLVQNEMEAELQFHVEARTEELVQSGVPRAEALRRARLEFGGMEGAKEECLEARGASCLDNLMQDLRYGARTMMRAPRFTTMAVLALALGIGANTAIFSVVNAVLPANFLDGRSQTQSFEGMSAYGRGSYTLTGNGEPETFRMIAVTDGMFSILHARPLLGRGFVSGEDDPGHEQEVVLSYGGWRRRFAGNPDIVGKNITLNARAFTVIGVMGPDFEFPISTDPSLQAQMWEPLALSDQDRAVRDNHNYAVVARLKPGVAVKQAQNELDGISNRLAQEYPSENRGWGAIAVPLRDDLVGDVRPALLILLGAVVLVLLIACANVANLVLVKALTRRKEQAVRVALGATRRRLLQQALAETLLLAFAGGALGLVFAHYGVILIVKFLAQRLPRSSEISLDGWVLAFTAGISLLAGFAAGLAPAFRAAKTDVNEALKQGLGRATSDSGGSRTRDLLVVSEVALSLMLLIGAGLLIRSLWMLHQVNPGFEAAQVVTMEVAVPLGKFTEDRK